MSTWQERAKTGFKGIVRLYECKSGPNKNLEVETFADNGKFLER